MNSSNLDGPSRTRGRCCWERAPASLRRSPSRASSCVALESERKESYVTIEKEEGLSALLHETRSFPPPADLAAQANAQPGIYQAAADDPLAFWADQASRLTWATPWSEILQW